MPVYMIVEPVEVKDQKMYGEYIQKVPAIVEKFGGTYLVRGGEATVVSGQWKPGRLIVIKFDSKERFHAWWNSPEYRAVAPLRERSTRTNAIVVEGV